MLFLTLPFGKFLSHHLLKHWLHLHLFVPVLSHCNPALHKNQSVPTSAHHSMLSPADKRYCSEQKNKSDLIQFQIYPKSAKYFHLGINLLSDISLPVHSAAFAPFVITLWKMYLHPLWQHPSIKLPAFQRSAPHAVLHNSFQHARHQHHKLQRIIQRKLLQSVSFFSVFSYSYAFPLHNIF